MNNGDLKGSNYRITKDCEVINNTTGRVLKQKTTQAGYKSVCLYMPEGKKYMFVHRLMAITFISNPHGYPEINHIDGLKANNQIANLEWCTSSQNQLHAYREGLQKPKPLTSYENGRYKGPITATSIDGKTSMEIRALTECENFGFNRGHVSSCILGKLKQHKGFNFTRRLQC